MDFDKLYKFIKKETDHHVDDSSPNFKLEKDLGIYGEEASDFLIKFSQEFNVDISLFNFSKHFSPEGDRMILSLINLFKKEKRKDLTMEELKNSIAAGVLK